MKLVKQYLMKTYLENINFKTILDDGKQKVEQNQTSLDEVYKVACFWWKNIRLNIKIKMK